MDGGSLILEMLDFLDRGESHFDLLGPRRLYGCLDEAACHFARVTGLLTSEVVITSVAGQQSYNLPPDFIRPWVRTRGERFVGRYDTVDGSISWIPKTDYSHVFLANRTDQVEIPSSFCIRQRAEAAEPIRGTVTASGSKDGGVVELIDDAADFSGVMVRDVVHNTTKSTRGLVLSVASPTSLRCAMFPSGRSSFISGNSYVVRPESRETLIFDAPLANSSDTLTLPCVVLPPPIYHSFAFLGLPPESSRAIAAEAAYIFSIRAAGFKPKPEHHNLFLAEIRQNKLDRAQAILQGSPDRGLM
jgi:hypothetical protein